MKRETINKIANFILTVITAFVSTFLIVYGLLFTVYSLQFTDDYIKR